MLIAACYVPASPYPFVELHVMLKAVPEQRYVAQYLLRSFSASGGERLPKRTDDENHARTYWTAATRGLELPEEAFLNV